LSEIGEGVCKYYIWLMKASIASYIIQRPYPISSWTVFHTHRSVLIQGIIVPVPSCYARNSGRGKSGSELKVRKISPPLLTTIIEEKTEGDWRTRLDVVFLAENYLKVFTWPVDKVWRFLLREESRIRAYAFIEI
jgi:hypothetical protein